MIGALIVAAAIFDAKPLTKPYVLTPADQKKVAAVVGEGLKDPDSAKYHFDAALDEYTYCGTVNAKNSYGGYNGPELFAVLYAKSLKGGIVVMGPAEIGSEIAIDMCQSVSDGWKAAHPK